MTIGRWEQIIRIKNNIGRRKEKDPIYLTCQFSSNFIHNCIKEFYNEFGIENIVFNFLLDTFSYQTLRRHVLQSYEQQKEMRQKNYNNPNNQISSLFHIQTTTMNIRYSI